MKTHRIWKFMLVTGKPDELDKVDKIADGTHFLTAYGDKRGKRGNKHIARIKNIDINGSAEPPTTEEVIAHYIKGRESSHVSD